MIEFLTLSAALALTGLVSYRLGVAKAANRYELTQRELECNADALWARLRVLEQKHVSHSDPSDAWKPPCHW